MHYFSYKYGFLKLPVQNRVTVMTLYRNFKS